MPCRITPQLTDVLRDSAHEYLAGQGIDGPVSWHPPADLAAGLTLPDPTPTNSISRRHTAWSCRSEHLDLLESYVAARLRERGDRLGSMSMLERLPVWLKSGKHRDEALRAIRRLRTSLRTP